MPAPNSVSDHEMTVYTLKSVVSYARAELGQLIWRVNFPIKIINRVVQIEPCAEIVIIVFEITIGWLSTVIRRHGHVINSLINY